MGEDEAKFPTQFNTNPYNLRIERYQRLQLTVSVIARLRCYQTLSRIRADSLHLAANNKDDEKDGAVSVKRLPYVTIWYGYNASADRWKTAERTINRLKCPAALTIPLRGISRRYLLPQIAFVEAGHRIRVSPVGAEIVADIKTSHLPSSRCCVEQRNHLGEIWSDSKHIPIVNFALRWL